MRPVPASTAVGRFFRNPATGDVVVAQWPNVPLWVFLVAVMVRRLFHPHDALGTAVSVVGTVALLVWAGLEVVRGDSPFRRVLGAVVLVWTVVGLLLR